MGQELLVDVGFLKGQADVVASSEVEVDLFEVFLLEDVIRILYLLGHPGIPPILIGEHEGVLGRRHIIVLVPVESDLAVEA